MVAAACVQDDMKNSSFLCYYCVLILTVNPLPTIIGQKLFFA